MRYAIYVVSTGRYDQAMAICILLRKIDIGNNVRIGIWATCILSHFSTIDFELIASSYLPVLFKKMGALKGSIKKVEQGNYHASTYLFQQSSPSNVSSNLIACYTFQIRGSEYPKEMYLAIIKDHQDKYEQQQQQTS